MLNLSISRRSHPSPGFTLLEVLVALAILGLAFAGMIYAINNNTRTLIAVEETTAGSWVAANVVARAQLGLLDGVTEGSEPQMGRTFYWQIERESTQNPQVKKLDVTVGIVRQGASIVRMTAYQEERLNEAS